MKKMLLHKNGSHMRVLNGFNLTLENVASLVHAHETVFSYVVRCSVSRLYGATLRLHCSGLMPLTCRCVLSLAGWLTASHKWHARWNTYEKSRLLLCQQPLTPKLHWRCTHTTSVRLNRKKGTSRPHK